jgi:hypothetical protein
MWQRVGAAGDSMFATGAAPEIAALLATSCTSCVACDERTYLAMPEDAASFTSTDQQRQA